MLLIKKILRKILDIIFRVFSGLSLSTFRAAHTNRSFDSMSFILIWMIDSLAEKYTDFTVDGARVAEIGSDSLCIQLV